MRESRIDYYPKNARGRILKVAVTLFAEKGFGGTTFAEIARRAKMSKPNVAYYFATSSELFLEVVKIWAQSGQEVTAELLFKSLGQPPKLLIGKIAEAVFIWAERYPELSAISPVLIQGAQIDAKVAALQNQVMSVGMHRILSLVEQDSHLSGLSKDKRTQLAETIHCLIVGSYFYSLAQGRDLNLTKKRTVNMIAEILANN